MNEIIKFLDIHYESALKLVSDFDITKNKEWNSQIYLNELYVQLGHVYNVLYSNDNVNELKRNINNLGDELSDVLLQLINLAYTLKINMYEINNIDSFQYDDINGFPILLGQLTEVIMEMNDCRFKKNRFGFNTSFDFIKDRLFKLFMLTYNIAKKYNLDMIKEFKDMLDDANGFLDRFENKTDNKKEYLDIYDKNENLIGYSDKETVHKNGYWHKVFGCLIFNSKRDVVFLQLKNPNHNKVNKKPLYEITVGGHLISGESVSDGIREIKEETGLSIKFKDLVFFEKRKISKKVNNNYIIKEFQYFYGLNKNINVSELTTFDNEEIISFAEVNIQDLKDLINDNKNSIKGINNYLEKVLITKSDLDTAFIENGLYLSLLNNINNKKKNKEINNKIKKLYKKDKNNKKSNDYYYDNGIVINHKNYSKGDLKYSVIMLKTDVDKNEYLVYLLLIYKNKSISHLLERKFLSKRGIYKYFNELSNYIDINNNLDIINKCIEKKKYIINT